MNLKSNEMKPIFAFLLFICTFNCTYSQTPINDGLIRRTLLTFVRDLSLSNSINVGEVVFDYDDNIISLHDGNDAVKVSVQWTSKPTFISKQYWVLGYVVKNPYSGRVYWFTEECSRNLNHYGRYNIGYLENEEEIIQAMGIGKPMRKKCEANGHRD